MALAGAVTGIEPRSLSLTGSGATARSYRADIDGLRALAILGVVLHHAGLPLLTGGFTGVDIFFVISGYLIGGHIDAELRSGDFSYLRFYQRRAKRIVPAFFAVLAFTLAAALPLLSPADMAKLARSGFAAVLSSSNILFWHSANYFDTRSELNPLLMTWSLGVEEQFYAVIPLALALLGRVRRNWMLPAIVAGCAVSFVLAWAALGRSPAFAFYMLPARAWELGIGVALAIAELNWSRSPIPQRMRETASAAGLALMIAPLFLLSGASPFPGPAALPSVLGAALCIAAPQSLLNRRVFSLAPVVFIGRVSYSWYLWHWPLLSFLHVAYGGEPPRAASLPAIAASFGAAVWSYFFIEQPFRSSRRAPAPLLRRYAISTAIALALCAVIWLSRGVPQRFPALAQLESGHATLASDPCLADEGGDWPILSMECVPSSAAPQVLALWGDSHAAALAPGLRSLAQAQHYGFAELAKSSCPPVIGTAHFVPRHPRLAEECIRYNANVLELIARSEQVHIVVLSSAWAGYLHRSWQDGWLVSSSRSKEMLSPEAAQDLLSRSLAASIRMLQAAGKQVIVIGEAPAFDFEPLWRIGTARIPARRLLATWLSVTGGGDSGFAAPGDAANSVAATSLLRKAVAAAPGASLVDLKPQLCNAAGECMYRDGDRLLYLDNNHLSPQGARFALRNVRLPGAQDAQAAAGREHSR